MMTMSLSQSTNNWRLTDSIVSSPKYRTTDSCRTLTYRHTVTSTQTNIVVKTDTHKFHYTRRHSWSTFSASLAASMLNSGRLNRGTLEAGWKGALVPADSDSPACFCATNWYSGDCRCWCNTGDNREPAGVVPLRLSYVPTTDLCVKTVGWDDNDADVTVLLAAPTAQ